MKKWLNGREITVEIPIPICERWDTLRGIQKIK
jgi:hypothetical protein